MTPPQHNGIEQKKMLRKPTFHADLTKQLSNMVGGVMTPPYEDK